MKYRAPPFRYRLCFCFFLHRWHVISFLSESPADKAPKDDRSEIRGTGIVKPVRFYHRYFYIRKRVEKK
jgi:hypothetical protein